MDNPKPATPYSPEAESASIAAILRDPRQYLAMADIIQVSDFYFRPYQWCWEAFATLVKHGQRIDEVTLGDELERMNKLDEFVSAGRGDIRSRAAIARLRSITLPRSESAESYAALVQDYAVKRRLLNFAGKLAEWAYNGRHAPDIVADAETYLSRIVLHGRAAASTVSAAVATAQAYAAFAAASKGEETGLATGLIDLDELLGIQNGELVTVAGRPGQGKSSLLASIALNVIRRRKRALFFTVEGSAAMLAQRLLAQISGVDSFRIRRGKLNEGETLKLQEAIDNLAVLPLAICDLGAIRIGQIRSEARKQKDLKVIFLDYIQLANADTKQDRRDQDIGEVTRGLVALAKELNVPVIAAAQLSRAVEAREDKKPMLSDLRESGSIEQDSSSVVFIHFPKPDTNSADLIVAKHRDGPVGTCSVRFLRHITRFENLSTRFQ